MRDLGPALNEEMVLSFIRAEINSPVWGPRYVEVLNQIGVDRASLIDNALLSDANANHIRAIALGCVRGFGRNVALFHNFPTDTTWRRVQIDPPEFQKLRYLNCEPFLRITDGTRSVEVGARNYSRDGGLAPRVDDLVLAIKNGALLPELILIENANRFVVLEGNTRATAYVKASTTSFTALVGTSLTMHQWEFI